MRAFKKRHLTAGATIKYYLIVGRKAAWGLGFEKQMTVEIFLKTGANT